MNNEKLNSLFQEIREEKVETSIQDVRKWIALSAASVGLFGLLSKFKLSFLLTKKIIIMSTLSVAMGIACAGIIFSSTPSGEMKQTRLLSKVEKVNPTTKLSSKSLELEKQKVERNKFKKPSTTNPTNLEAAQAFDISTLPIQEPSALSEFQITSLPPLSHKVSSTKRQVEDGIAIEVRELKSFTKLNLTSAFDIYLSQGSSQSVRVEVDERYIDRVETEVSGNRLNVKINKGGSINNPKKWALYITVVNLEEIEVSGAIDLHGEGTFNVNDLSLKTSGASDINLNIISTELKMDVSGACDIELKGNIDNLNLEASGASTIKMFDCNVQNANIEISGATVAKVNVSGKLKVEASGASKLKNKRKPESKDISVSGASKVSM